VGVTLYEGMKTKTGGKDFSSLFRKPSKYDYLSLVKETAKNQSVSISNFDKTNEIGLISNGDQFSKLSYNLPKTVLTMKNDKGSLQNSYRDSINVNKHLNVSLKSVLDRLEIFPNLDKDLNDNNLTLYDKDIFKYQKRNLDDKEKSTIDQEEINRFNYSIVNDQSWGNLNGNVANRTKNKSIDFLKTKYPVKPNKKIFEKELGIDRYY